MSEPTTGRITRNPKSGLPPVGLTRYRVASSAAMVYVRVEGLGNMRSAPVLLAFLIESRAGGAVSACIDLSACQGMDSTFMGLLVGQAQQHVEAGGKLVVVKPNELCQRLLSMLGVDEVVPVLAEATVPEADLVDLAGDTAVDATARMALVRQAHRDLSGLNEANKAKFSAFLSALEADLDRQRPT